VPTLAEDLQAFGTPTIGIGFTAERAAHRAAGSTKKAPGTEKTFGGYRKSRDEYAQKAGVVEKYSDDRYPKTVCKLTGKKISIFVPGAPMLRGKGVDVTSDILNPMNTEHVQIARAESAQQQRRAMKAAAAVEYRKAWSHLDRGAK
jgi:hypothetical protein